MQAIVNTTYLMHSEPQRQIRSDLARVFLVFAATTLLSGTIQECSVKGPHPAQKNDCQGKAKKQSLE